MTFVRSNLEKQVFSLPKEVKWCKKCLMSNQRPRIFFDKLKLRCKPKKGKAVVFFPSYLDGEIDQKALHCAETVIDEKWVSQLCIRDKIQ